MAGLTKAEMLEAAKHLFRELIKGDDEGDVADIMGWDESTAAKIKKVMLDAKVDEVKSLTPEQTFIQYMIDQKRNLHDLNQLINHLDARRNHNAVVGAIRLRSDITDKVLERGFDFGILQKKQNAPLGSGNTFVLGGVDVRVLSAPQLQDAIKTQLNELSELVEGYGEGKSILELPTGELHYGPSVVDMPPEPEPVLETPAPETRSEKPARKKRSID